MSYEGPSICEYCRREQHCVWDGFGKMSGCHCICPNPRHFSANIQALEAHLKTCGKRKYYGPIAERGYCGDKWYCFTGRELAKKSDAVCGAVWNPTAAFFATDMWTHVTCPPCLSLRPQTAR